jgi:ketosteroid isomerase-like protein
MLTKSILIALGSIAIVSCGKRTGDNAGDRIIAMERAALDRWGKGDVNGYLEIYGPDITYFDPALEKRIDGHEAVSKYIGPFDGKIGIESYSMIDPKVQQYCDVAVLTYNLVDDVNKTPAGPVHMKTRWNCTQVYIRVNDRWEIVHNHWSYTKPELKKSE